MSKLIIELQKEEDYNLSVIKNICSFFTISNDSDILLLFNDNQREEIEACTKIRTLFTDKLRSCWKWNDFATLKMIIQ